MAAAYAHRRGDEFIELHQWAITGLTEAITRRLKEAPPELERPAALPGVMFFSLFEDRTFDHYRWTAEMRKLRDMLVEAGSR